VSYGWVSVRVDGEIEGNHNDNPPVNAKGSAVPANAVGKRMDTAPAVIGGRKGSAGNRRARVRASDNQQKNIEVAQNLDTGFATRSADLDLNLVNDLRVPLANSAPMPWAGDAGLHDVYARKRGGYVVSGDPIHAPKPQLQELA
jgi:hypothetical protein